ncbi:MAG: HDOD domain-containing protein [Deltaproteobacteria bacterium]|nr:HDOD domain-containing protein [Deltaproteobacteria bacterium]
MEKISSPESTRQRILEILSRTKDILTLPTIVQEILDVTSSKNTSASDLTKILESDPVLTAKILAVSNSAYYGFVKKVSTVSHAVVVLGFQEIQNIALSMSVLKLFDRRGSEFSDKLWRHSFAVAVATRMIADYLKMRMDGKYFVGGLLHDVGKIFLGQYLPELFNRLLVSMDDPKNKLTYHALELRFYGISHAEIGGRLLKSWMFPPDIADVTSFHHDPSKAENDPLFVACVHLADILCTFKGISPLKDQYFFSVDKEALGQIHCQKADFSTKDMHFLLSRLEIEIERQSSFVSVFRR